MNAFLIGQFTGMVIFSLLVPAIIMIILKLIPRTRNSHKLTYGLCGTIAVLTPWIPHPSFSSLVASLLLVAFFAFGYSRAKSKVKPVTP